MKNIKRQITILRPTNYGKEEKNFKHLYILLTDPCFDGETGLSDMVMSVSCSSIKNDKPFDDTCVLKAGCHEFITKDSFIFYRHLRIEPAEEIRANIENGYFIQKALIDDDIYNAILQGLMTSTQIEKRYKRFIKNAINQNACLDPTQPPNPT